MGDPEQTDLIEFLAGDAARAATQPPAPPGNARARLPCVQFEHSLSLRRIEQAAEYVQNEHTGLASRIENSRSDVEPNAAAAPMSPHRLLVCLAVLGWPER